MVRPLRAVTNRGSVSEPQAGSRGSQSEDDTCRVSLSGSYRDRVSFIRAVLLRTSLPGSGQ